MSLIVGELTDVVEHLKCSNCKKILSVFPVHISAKNGYLCGRCFPFTREKMLRRATAYEAVAKFLIFPCSNNEIGCNAQLKHADIVAHENICAFQKFKCPCSDVTESRYIKCYWLGILRKLPEHLKVTHPTVYRENPLIFLMDLTLSSSLVYYFCFELNTFVITIQYEKVSNFFYCFVTSFGNELDPNLYNYQLEISNTKNYAIVFQKPITDNWQQKTVDIKRLGDKVITVDVSSVFTLIGNTFPSLGFKISIMKISDSEGSLSKDNNKSPICGTASSPVEYLQANQQLLEEMECPICSEYMFPPIFICTTGHSICCNCKPKIKECPTCRAVNMNIRNYALEKMVLQFQYPCRYASSGCDKTCLHGGLRNHEINCVYQTSCILKTLLKTSCDLKKEIINNVHHIREHHNDLIMLENFEYGISTESNIPVSNRVVISDEEIFLLCFSRVKTAMKFNVLHFGLNFKVVRYRYKISFIDGSENGLTLVMSKLCQGVPANMGDALKKCLVIPLDMLEPFIAKNGPALLQYKFIIEKI